jgi:hypothetical protein
MLLGEPNRVRAVSPMHTHAPPTRHETKDLVSGHWGAAVREAHQKVLESLDVNANLRVAPEVVTDRVRIHLWNITALESGDPLSDRPR